MMYEVYKIHCIKLQENNQFRSLQIIDYAKCQNLLDFTSNDYLALSRRQELLSAAILAGKEYGVGATGSRLISGNKKIFHELESRIAKDKGTEESLVFCSGFQTNLTVLASLLDQQILKTKPIVFFDRLNHSSLYQAVFLSKAELIRYHHNDMNHLAELLNNFKNVDRPKFIITETIFGMDGDILPIEIIVKLAKQHNAFLYLDEAHATGILGPKGYGLSTTISLEGISCLIMGTFSKAIGVAGGYIACNKILKEYIINKTTGFIYSTATSPMIIGATLESWNIIQSLDNQRRTLFILSDFLRENLINIGFNIGKSASHIIPIIIGDENLVTLMKEKLFMKGILVSSIRPPTVPRGTSRLRIALSVNHTKQDVLYLIDCLKNL